MILPEKHTQHLVLDRHIHTHIMLYEHLWPQAVEGGGPNLGTGPLLLLQMRLAL